MLYMAVQGGQAGRAGWQGRLAGEGWQGRPAGQDGRAGRQGRLAGQAGRAGWQGSLAGQAGREGLAVLCCHLSTPVDAMTPYRMAAG